MPPDVDVLKVDVPSNATHKTPWEVTRISRVRLFEAIPPKRDNWLEPTTVGYRFAKDWASTKPGSDIHAIRINQQVSVTPLSLDMTSRIQLQDFEKSLRSHSAE